METGKFSRRGILRLAAGTAGVSFLGVREGLAIRPSSSRLDEGGLFRLFPEGDAHRPFGAVKDFASHIQHRSDVKKELLFWLTDGRASLLGAASRFQFIQDVVRPLYEKAGIPLEFGFGLGVQESLFRNYSVSYADAKGIWQLQWAGRQYGLRGGDYFDIVKSTQKQLEYLKDLVREFDWNLELVLVDYNWGPGHRFARYRSDPNAFQKVVHRLPKETQRFVPRILAAIAIGLEPERYGMEIPRLDTETIEVETKRDLHHLELGLLLGTDHWNLGNLNPRESIRVWFKEGEAVRIPRAHEEDYKRADEHAMRDEFRSFVSDVFPAPGQETRYVVKSGDTLIGISRRFRECGVQGPEHLMLYNGLSSTRIHPGQELIIPCGR